jgi:hypothetical protein
MEKILTYFKYNWMVIPGFLGNLAFAIFTPGHYKALFSVFAAVILIATIMDIRDYKPRP